MDLTGAAEPGVVVDGGGGVGRGEVDPHRRVDVLVRLVPREPRHHPPPVYVRQLHHKLTSLEKRERNRNLERERERRWREGICFWEGRCCCVGGGVVNVIGVV